MALTQLRGERVRQILHHEQGLLIDLRPVDDYLGRHLFGSVPLLYEEGPGFSGRARDLLPLSARCILIRDSSSPLDDAADMLRGKGFDVPGYLDRLSDLPDGEIVTTDVVTLMRPGTLKLLNVCDPGTDAPRSAEVIPAERLWTLASELDRSDPIGVLAGWGVRAAAAVGILEHLGFRKVLFVRTLPAGANPPVAGPEATIFRVSGR